jgi:hypothetical protein
MVMVAIWSELFPVFLFVFPAIVKALPIEGSLPETDYEEIYRIRIEPN